MLANLTRSLALLPRAQTAPCYFPSGSISLNDRPCSSSGNNSFCCAPGWACLDEKVCMSTSAVEGWNGAAQYLRGSCTDKRWGDACPLFCLQGPSVNNNNNQTMTRCNTPGNITYCCDNIQVCNCANGDTVESFPDFINIETMIGVSSSSTSPPPKTSSPSSSSASITIASLTNSYSASSPPSSTSQSIPEPHLPANLRTPGTKPSTLVVGIVFGGAFGVAALVALGHLFRHYRRRNKNKKTPSGPKSAGIWSRNSSFQTENKDVAPPAYERGGPEKPDDIVAPVEMPAESSRRLGGGSGSGEVYEMA